ncbi:unnamed protein product [Cylicocyclus nassatus]|uniref:Major facilitator superfamily (MFS) profile domain-containing protein n=1 Tax=Cylicocyclus nassatus TaxID=53992 RepID=A0AA36MD97_CYLNA|nr:unnamed protein product [Cylicocyclus nassatus]
MAKIKDCAASFTQQGHHLAEPKTPWKSVYLAGACSFVQAAQFSIYISSMWPYLRTLDPDAVETQFGYIVALYSFAQCISAPCFGYWSNRIEQVRLPLLAGFCCMMLGNIIYLSLSFASRSRAAIMMIVARFIQGCGAGNMSLLRAYVSTSSSKTDRSRAIACVSGGIASGTLIGPAFQLLFTPLGPEGVYVLPFYRLHIYNSPALFSLMMNIVGFLVLWFLFEENYDVLKADAAKMTKQLPSPCVIAVLICIGTRFAQVFSTSTIATLGSAFSMLMFDFNKEQSVATNATAQLVAGIIGATLYIFFIFFNLSSWIRPRVSAIACLCAYVGLFATTYPWPFIRQKVRISVNGSDWGCFSDRFDWCEDLAKVSPWLYYTFYVIVVGVAISVMNIALTTLYSEVIGPRRQGTFQGYFQMAAAMGSMLAPLITSNLYAGYGPKAPWILVIMLICTIIVLWVAFHRKMVPLNIEDDDNTSHKKDESYPPCNACQFASSNASPPAKLLNVLNLVLQAAINNAVLASKSSSSHNNSLANHASNPAVAPAPPLCAKALARPAVLHLAGAKHHLRLAKPPAVHPAAIASSLAHQPVDNKTTNRSSSSKPVRTAVTTNAINNVLHRAQLPSAPLPANLPAPRPALHSNVPQPACPAAPHPALSSSRNLSSWSCHRETAVRARANLSAVRLAPPLCASNRATTNASHPVTTTSSSRYDYCRLTTAAELPESVPEQLYEHLPEFSSSGDLSADVSADLPANMPASLSDCGPLSTKFIRLRLFDWLLTMRWIMLSQTLKSYNME